MLNFKQFVTESGGPGWEAIHKGGFSNGKKKSSGIPDAHAHKAGFRSGLAGHLPETYGSREHYDAGHKAGTAKRKELLGKGVSIPPRTLKRPGGYSRPNAQYNKFVDTHYSGS